MTSSTRTTSPSFSVGEVARLAGVTIRTLHHYDEMGLLTPGDRTPAGYRRYGLADLERLQRIRCYRELEFPLEEIGALLDGADDPVEHLRRQHRLLTERRDRLDALLAAIERTMEARKMGLQLDPEEMFEVFGGFDPREHQAEVEERWGDTDAYRRSAERASRYTKADWLRLKAEQDAINDGFVAALQAGEPADSEVAMDLAERARLQIHTWFYDCSHAMHAGLAQMYIDDPRFRATYEDLADGLAEYVHGAVVSNAARHGPAAG